MMIETHQTASLVRTLLCDGCVIGRSSLSSACSTRRRTRRASACWAVRLAVTMVRAIVTLVMQN